MKRLNERGFVGSAVIVVTIVLATVAVCVAIFLSRSHSQESATKLTNNTPTTANTTQSQQPAKQESKVPTNDEIFQEVAQAFGLQRGGLTYFRIFSQDKVQYNTGHGATFAYKLDGAWHIALKDSTGQPLCSELTSVPETFRPGCYDQASNKDRYMNSDQTNTNYPPADAYSYIGK